MTRAADSPQTVRLLTLCDNTSTSAELGKEWGLSFAVTLPGDRLWLFDTGQTPLFLSNARKLGVDLGRATGLVLSHGHYDHTGGLWALMQRTGFQGAVYGHPLVTKTRFSIKDGSPPRSNGIPNKSRECLDNFNIVRGTRELDQGLTMLTDIRRAPGRYEPVYGFFFDEAGTVPDSIEDDAFLLLETPKGPVAVMGCCHSGLANSLLHMREETGVDRLYAVAGGLHLGYA
ncbi:MAG: MBL fold metallo-hydrolase, partial [Desulfovibrionaceae bacterium]